MPVSPYVAQLKARYDAYNAAGGKPPLPRRVHRWSEHRARPSRWLRDALKGLRKRRVYKAICWTRKPPVRGERFEACSPISERRVPGGTTAQTGRRRVGSGHGDAHGTFPG